MEEVNVVLGERVLFSLLEGVLLPKNVLVVFNLKLLTDSLIKELD